MLKVVDKVVCKSKLKEAINAMNPNGYVRDVTNQMLCAESGEGDVCDGDGGGILQTC